MKGISGETTEDMIERFDRDVIENKPDYVIILGGTNDLGWDIPLNNIMSNLSFMYKKALSNNITPIAVSIPSIRGFDSAIPQRITINKMILQTCQTLNIPFIDLFIASSEPHTLRLALSYSNDGLHLSTDG
ncbi:lysophospholipase L1-like esterase, partial [Candidatus Magnetoovum chiemensis]